MGKEHMAAHIEIDEVFGKANKHKIVLLASTY